VSVSGSRASGGCSPTCHRRATGRTIREPLIAVEDRWARTATCSRCTSSANRTPTAAPTSIVESPRTRPRRKRYGRSSVRPGTPSSDTSPLTPPLLAADPAGPGGQTGHDSKPARPVSHPCNRVHEVEPQVPVAVTQLDAADPVCWGEVQRFDLARGDEAEELLVRGGAEAVQDQP